jgi:NlpC/P60 family putative phage cell wall peptidase
VPNFPGFPQIPGQDAVLRYATTDGGHDGDGLCAPPRAGPRRRRDRRGAALDRHALCPPGASTRGAGCDCLGLARGIWPALYGAEAGPVPAYTPSWGETGRREVLREALRARMIEIGPELAATGALLVFRMAPGRLAKHCGVLIDVPE